MSIVLSTRTILQQMYLKVHLQVLSKGRFIEMAMARDYCLSNYLRICLKSIPSSSKRAHVFAE